MSWLDLFLQLLLAAAVYVVIQVLSRVWENRQACRVADDTAAPENNENPVAQDKPPLSGKLRRKKTEPPLSSDSAILFPKLTSAATTRGQDQEVALCSLLFLRGLRLCSTFFLANNHRNAGAFDDAVFIYRRCSTRQLHVLLVQSKHKEKAAVCYDTLLGSKNEKDRKNEKDPENEKDRKNEKDGKSDFCLSKYQKSHNVIDKFWRSFSINGEIVTGVKYVLYTNAPLRLKEGIGSPDSSGDVCDFLLTSGAAHKFSLGDVERAFPAENQEAAASFLQDFTFCHGQMNCLTSNDFIENEIRLLLKTDSEDTSNIRILLTSLIKVWWDVRGEAEFLARDSHIWRTIVISRLENMNSETRKLAEKHRLTFEERSAQELKNTLRASRSLILRVNTVAEVTLVRLKIFQTLEMPLILSVESMTDDDLEKAIALWKTDFCDALVLIKERPCERLELKLLKTLSLLHPEKFVILISTSDVDDPVWVKRCTGITWDDLHTKTKDSILNITVTFQNSPAILSDLIGNRGDILSPEHILLLSERSEDIVLGKSAVTEKVICYQKRSLTRKTRLNESFFKFIKNEKSVCSLDVIPEGEDGRMLQGITIVDYDTFNNYRENPNENNNKIFKLRVINNEFIYEDCVGEGALNIVRKHLSDHVTQIIENIWEVEDKKIIINGYPGIGKSSFVTDMCFHSAKRRPLEWTVRVNIRDHRELLKDLKRGDFVGSKITTILTSMYTGQQGSRCTLEETLLLHALNEVGNVTLLIDAVDEACPEFEETCIELLRALVSKVRYRKLLVTTRLVTCREVEDVLNVLAFDLPGFTSGQLTRFLKDYCAFKKLSKSDSEIAQMVSLAGKCMQVPLLARMAAEEGVVDSFLRTELFRIFVDKEVEKFLTDKLSVKPYQMGYKENLSNQKESQNEKFMRLAVMNLIDTEDLLKLKFDTSGIVNALKDSKSDLIVSNGEKVHFVHRSFDEFFLGMWLSRHWRDRHVSELCRKLLFRVNFEFVRESFESFLVQNHELHKAVSRGNTGTVENILKSKGRGCCRHARDGGQRNVLHVAATASKGDLVLWDLLVKYGAPLEDIDGVLGWTPLQYAITALNLDFSEFLLKNGASEASVTVLDGYDCACAVLAKSCSEGRVRLTQLVLQKRPKLLKTMFQDDGSKALHLAVRSGNVELVKLLLDMKAGVTAVNYSGRNAVSEAAFYGHTHLLRLFHARRNFTLVGITTPLHCAAVKGHVDALEFLLKEAKLDVDLEEVAESNTALQDAAETGCIEAMKRLMEAGANINHKNSVGSTALHGACRKSQLEAVNLLLKSGALVNVKDENGRTPLAVASHSLVQKAVREAGGYT